MVIPGVAELTPMLLGIKWLDPEWLQHEYGSAFIWIALGIVFVECGLFFPFLPGDTLLFALGLFIAGSDATGYSVFGISNEPVELVIAMLLLTVSAFAGNVAGYEIGRKLGPPLYERNGRILKKKYFDNTSAFFEKHGSKALVIGRFVPFVRTYITVVAGVTQMERRRFFVWSAIGAVLWILSITLLGYFLGAAFPWLGNNIDYVTVAILAFTVVPLVYEWFKHRHHQDDHHDDHQVADPIADEFPGTVEA
ncbi:DedA family protein [Nocardioides plantarum]|uniref:DedA family protein n=1 Tax=Nocardioides plantarum TaxID=29299 RepID=A0ABV5K4C0_9ACTN|nr:VTT domain-containing protein [Nocardioides plantarum]